jgi:photosystem II stability/assembly factor-like uncharacterized protein
VIASGLLLLLTLLSGSISATATLPSDIDRDGVVDFPDFLIFATAWGSPTEDRPLDPRVDLDTSGTIDFNDLLIFLDDYGKTGPDVGNNIGNGLEIVHGPDGPEGADHDNPFRSFTVHPTDANTLLMGTERNGFVKSTDGGQTWTRHRQGLRHNGPLYPEVWDVAYDPSDPAVVYTATLDSPGPVTGDYPSSVGGVYKSEDGGETWARKNCGFTNSNITGIDVLPGSPSTVIAGIRGGTASFSDRFGEFFGGGLYRSTDGGETWSRSVTAVDDTTNAYLHIVSRPDPDTRADTVLTFGLHFSDSDRNSGFLKSADGGLSWEPFAPDLRALPVTGFAVSLDGKTLIGNARDNFRLRVSTDAGATWATTDINQANGPVAISHADPARIMFVSSQTTLNLSEDGLVSFNPVLSTNANIEEIVFAPSDPSIVFVTADGLEVYRSDNGGRSFRQLVNIRAELLNPEAEN